MYFVRDITYLLILTLLMEIYYILLKFININMYKP